MCTSPNAYLRVRGCFSHNSIHKYIEYLEHLCPPKWASQNGPTRKKRLKCQNQKQKSTGDSRCPSWSLPGSLRRSLGVVRCLSAGSTAFTGTDGEIWNRQLRSGPRHLCFVVGGWFLFNKAGLKNPISNMILPSKSHA